MKQTEKHVQFTPDSYRDYNLPANTRLFHITFGSAERNKVLL